MKFISYAAIALVGLAASPFALGVFLLLIAALVGVIVVGVTMVAIIIAWAVPLLISIAVALIAFYAITELLDS